MLASTMSPTSTWAKLRTSSPDHLFVGGFQGQRAAVWIDFFHPRGHDDHLGQFCAARFRNQHRSATRLGLLRHVILGLHRCHEARDQHYEHHRTHGHLSL
jgi:hypothetical protein